MDKVDIIFLDIDGVLNHSPPAEDTYFDTFAERTLPLSKDNLAAFRKILAAKPDAKVVWSTDWRLYDEPKWRGRWDNPRLWLERQDWMAGRIIGKTPKKMTSNHFHEIHWWLLDNIRRPRVGIHNFVILDDWDSPGMSDYGSNFFKTDPDAGLTEQQADDVIQYLQSEHYCPDEWIWDSERTLWKKAQSKT